jgi:dolichol-phosphate mannosyltransferase
MSSPSTSTENRASAETQPGARPSLSVIMPGYNEEANVERAVRRAVTALERAGLDFEIIVVDDGSTDRTGEVAERMARADGRIRVLRNERNVNYGVSLQRGIQAARNDWILHDGMDLPLAPEDVAEISLQFEGADVVVMRRLDLGAHPPWRKLTSRVNNLLLRALFRPRAADLNFVQFYRRSWAQSVTLMSTSPAFVTPELILRAERSGRSVREVAAVFQRRETGKGHFGRPKDVLWTLKDMLRLRLRVWLRGWEG